MQEIRIYGNTYIKIRNISTKIWYEKEIRDNLNWSDNINIQKGKHEEPKIKLHAYRRTLLSTEDIIKKPGKPEVH